MLNQNAEYYRIIQPNKTIADSRIVPPRAFVPRLEDRDHLSVYDKNLIEPRECLNLYNRSPNRPPARALAIVTAAEIQELELKVAPAPGNHPAHCTIDFTPVKLEARNAASIALQRLAQHRGVILDP